MVLPKIMQKKKNEWLTVNPSYSVKMDRRYLYIFYIQKYIMYIFNQYIYLTKFS